MISIRKYSLGLFCPLLEWLCVRSRIKPLSENRLFLKSSDPTPEIETSKKFLKRNKKRKKSLPRTCNNELMIKWLQTTTEFFFAWACLPTSPRVVPLFFNSKFWTLLVKVVSITNGNLLSHNIFISTASALVLREVLRKTKGNFLMEFSMKGRGGGLKFH